MTIIAPPSPLADNQAWIAFYYEMRRLADADDKAKRWMMRARQVLTERGCDVLATRMPSLPQPAPRRSH